MLKHILIFVSVVVTTTSFHIPQQRIYGSSSSSSSSFRQTALSMNNDKSMSSLVDTLKKSFIPITLLTASLLVANPMNAEAARSGGRSGGSSFRSAPSRSSTQLRSGSGYSGQSNYQTRPNINIMPMYSPFGYGMSPFGFNPFGFVPINLNFIIIAGVAYAAYSVLSNRVGGSDFSNGDDSGALGSGSTVMKVQVALDSDWSDSSNVMNILARLAEKNGAMSGREDLAKLLSDASLALLRKQGDWNSAAYEGDLFKSGGQIAELAFQKLAIKERAKFEEETSSIASIRPSSNGGSPTQVVVSIVVALRGKSSGYMTNNLRSTSDVAMCLQGLAADALTDDGNNVLACNVLWTPSEAGNTISPRELITDYPELLKL